MKNMLNYKLFESWSEDYTLDFSDHGFEIEENGKKLKGRFKGKFVISDLNLWYSELIDRLNYQYDVISSKQSFNIISNIASFEVEVMDKDLESLSVFVNDKEFKVYPEYITFMDLCGNNRGFVISLQCKTESGSKITVSILTEKYDSYLGRMRPSGDRIIIDFIYFYLGQKKVGVHIKPEQLEGLLKIIRGLQIQRDGRGKIVDMNESEKAKLEEIINGNSLGAFSTRDRYRVSLIDAINKLGEWDKRKSAYIINK